MLTADLVIFALLLVLLGLLFTSQRRRQQRFAALQARLSPGQQVVTTSGLYAQIIEIDDTVLVLEIAPGLNARWDRRAVARILIEEPDQQADRSEPSDVSSFSSTQDPTQDPTAHNTKEK